MLMLLCCVPSRSPKYVGAPLVGLVGLFLAKGSEVFKVPLLLDTQTLTIALVLTSLIGIVVVYMWNPMSNPRLVNVLQWAMQGVGLVCVAASVHLPAVGIALAVCVLILYLLCGACCCGTKPSEADVAESDDELEGPAAPLLDQVNPHVGLMPLPVIANGQDILEDAQEPQRSMSSGYVSNVCLCVIVLRRL